MGGQSLLLYPSVTALDIYFSLDCDCHLQYDQTLDMRQRLLLANGSSIPLTDGTKVRNIPRFITTKH